MKNRKTIFALLNLVLFLSSMLFSSLNGFSSKQLRSVSGHIQHEVTSKQSNGDGGCSQILFEKNENETEHGLHEQVVLLPFSITFYHFETPSFFHVSAQPLAEKLTNPIYISVCNFRI